MQVARAMRHVREYSTPLQRYQYLVRPRRLSVCLSVSLCPHSSQHTSARGVEESSQLSAATLWQLVAASPGWVQPELNGRVGTPASPKRAQRMLREARAHTPTVHGKVDKFLTSHTHTRAHTHRRICTCAT